MANLFEALSADRGTATWFENELNMRLKPLDAKAGVSISLPYGVLDFPNLEVIVTRKDGKRMVYHRDLPRYFRDCKQIFVDLEQLIQADFGPKPKRPLSGTGAHLQRRGPQALRDLVPSRIIRIVRHG